MGGGVKYPVSYHNLQEFVARNSGSRRREYREGYETLCWVYVNYFSSQFLIIPLSLCK